MKKITLSILTGLLVLLARGSLPAQPADSKSITMTPTARSGNFAVGPVSPGKYPRMVFHIRAVDDGDGGAITYEVRYCPVITSFACRSFSPALTATLTIGGDEFDSVAVNTVFHQMEVNITSSSALAFIVAEYVP